MKHTLSELYPLYSEVSGYKYEINWNLPVSTICLHYFSILIYPTVEPGYCPVKLGMTAGRLQSGVNTLQGFKEDKRNKVTPGK